MRHGCKVNHLSRTHAHRVAMLSNMAHDRDQEDHEQGLRLHHIRAACQEHLPRFCSLPQGEVHRRSNQPDPHR